MGRAKWAVTCVASAVAAATLGVGCSPVGAPVLDAAGAPSAAAPQAPAPPPRRVPPETVRIAGHEVPDLRPVPLADGSTAWRITGAPGFDAALAAAVRSAAAASGGPVDSWPVGSSSDLVGIRIAGRSGGRAGLVTTWWYSLHQGRALANSELLADPPPGLTGVAFTAAGDAVLELVQAGPGVVPAAAGNRLTDAGRAAGLSAGYPLNPVVPRAVDCAVARCIALTFDDGPSEFTYPLLTTLAQHRASATFFLRGSAVAERRDVVVAMAAAGHQIGNHTQQHLRLPEQDTATIAREISDTTSALAGVPRNGSAVFRPPYGLHNAQVRSAAAAAGYSVVMWNLDPLDYRTTDAATIADRVLSAAGRGSVVLSHDTLPATEAAYRTIIGRLRSAGYELVTVDQLLGPGSPGEVLSGY